MSLISTATRRSWSIRFKRWSIPILFGIVMGYVGYFSVFYPNPGFPRTIDLTSWLTAAKMVTEGKGPAIYDLSVMSAYQQQAFGSYSIHGGILVYNRIPFFLIPLIPLTYLPYLWSYLIWIMASVVAGAAAIWLIVRYILPASGKFYHTWLEWSCLAAAFFPVLWSLYQGQTSLFELLLLTAFYLLLRHHHDTWAGILLGLTLFKPQTALLFGLILFMIQSWRGLLAFIMTGAVLGGVSLVMVGWNGLREYLVVTNQVYQWNCINGIYPEFQQSWRGLLIGFWSQACTGLNPEIVTAPAVAQANFVSNILNLLTIGILIIVWWRWRKVNRQSQVFDLLFCLGCLTSLIASPYSNPQELTRMLLVAALVVRVSGMSPGLFPHWLKRFFIVPIGMILGLLVETPIARTIKPFVWLMLFMMIILYYVLVAHRPKARLLDE